MPTPNARCSPAAVDVELVSVGAELAVVAAGGADEHHHDAALRYGLAVAR